MDPDASVPVDEPSVFNYVLSFLLVGVAWGFTTPFIRRAAADFNARQEAHQKYQAQTVPETQPVQSTTELQDQSPPTTSATKNGDETEEGSEEESGEEDQPLTSNARSRTSAAADAGSSTPVPTWMKPKSTSSWLPTKIVTVFWTVVNLLRTPAYSIPLVINLTGSVWFFLLVGKHELSLTVPLANSSAFLFTVLGEWYVERKVIEKETWLGMALVLGGIGICVHSKN
ncbi:transmembrane protein 234 homolog, partial [Aspergillus udagawae]